MTAPNCGKAIRALLGACIVAWIASASASAQSIVTVSVRSADSAQFLPNARVELATLGREAATDAFGTAEFTGVPPGSHTIRVTHEGFPDSVAEIRVGVDARVEVPVVLRADAPVELERYVITVEREGNAAALTRQKNAPGVENVISMDALGVLANDNPAELLTRLPGIYSLPSTEGNFDRPVIRGLPGELNATTVDGGRLAPQFSMTRSAVYTNITASQFEEIQVTKALTPNLPADSISGRVNFKSKSTLNMGQRRELTFRIGAKWSPSFLDFTPRRTSPSLLPHLTLGYREVLDLFGGTRNVGIGANGVFSENITQRTRTISNLDTAAPEPRFTERFQRYDGIQDRRLRTAGFRVDFRHSADSRFFVNFLRNFQEQRTNSPDHYQVDYLANLTTAGRAFATGVNASGGPSGGGNIRPGSTEQRTEVLPSGRASFVANTSPFEAGDKTFFDQFGGEHRIGPWRIDYTVGLSRGERNTGGRFRPSGGRNFTANVPSVGWILDKTRDAEFPTFTQTAGASIFEPRSYASATVSQSFNYSINRADTAEFNVRRDVAIGGRAVQLTAGGLAGRQSFRNDNYSRAFTYLGPDGVAGTNPATRVNDDDLTRFASLPRLEPRLGLGPVPAFDPDKYNTSIDTEPAMWRTDPYRELSTRRAGQDYVEERMLAAYAMGSTRIGRLGVLGGVRWEKTLTRSSGYLQSATLPTITDPAARVDAEYGTEPMRRRGSTQRLYPSVHFRHAFTPSLIGRASWSTSIGRPSLSDLQPNVSANEVERTVTIDNPSLKPQFADNFDVALEYYLKPMGLVSIGLFRKELADFVFRQEVGVVDPGPDNGFGGRYAGYDLYTNANGGRGRVDGIEFSYLQSLTFLPGALRGLTVLVNYTHIRATGDYGQDSGGPGGLVGFVPDTANVRLGYRYRRITPYVQWSYVGRTLGSYNVLPQMQTNRLERRIVNAGCSIGLPRNLEFFLDVSNLLDEPQRTAHFVTGARISTIYNGPFISAGINGKF